MQPTVLNCFSYASEKDLFASVCSPVDLMDRPSARQLLRRCDDTTVGHLEQASDYELFRVLCKARPFLFGHPTLRRFEFALQHFLGVSASLCEDQCDAVWRACVDRLLFSSVTKWNLLDQARVADVHVVFEPRELTNDLPQGIRPVLNASTLYKTSADTWEVWKTEMEQTISAFSLRGCQHVLLHLSEDYCDADPNPYTVGKALQEKGKNGQSLLLAQTFRFLSQACQDTGCTLILRVSAPKSEVLSLLKRTEQTVGIPALIWTAKNDETAEALLDASLQSHPHAMRCGVCLADHPSDKELETRLAFCAARYPIGSIIALAGTHPLDSLYEQARFLKIWQSVERSIL